MLTDSLLQRIGLASLSHEQTSDDVLAQRLRTGDGAALEALFRRHAQGLLVLASSIMGSRLDGEDVVQDVFIGLQLALRGYDERGQFSAWLRSVTVRTALSTRRRVARRREADPDPVSALLVSPGDIEQRTSIRDAVQRLPYDLRVVFILRIAEGYSHAEIARCLDIRAGTSEVRLFRAVRRLRALLSE